MLSPPGGTFNWQAPETLLGRPAGYPADIFRWLHLPHTSYHTHGYMGERHGHRIFPLAYIILWPLKLLSEA